MLSSPPSSTLFSFFFFNDTATTEIYTLSLHDALPIFHAAHRAHGHDVLIGPLIAHDADGSHREQDRSEEHTSELQSQSNLVCRLLLEKKKIAIFRTYEMSSLCHVAHQMTLSVR